MKTIPQQLEKRILVLDGAMGTMLQSYNYQLPRREQLNLIPHRFHIDLPDTLVREVSKCSTNAQVRQVGIAWCIQQSKELQKAKVPVLHYYSMGKSDNIKQIAEAIF